MKHKKELGIIILLILALTTTSAYLILTPQYKTINMSGYTLEVPNSENQVKENTNNYNTYEDTNHNLTIKSWAWKNTTDLNLTGCYDIGIQLGSNYGENTTYDNISIINKSGTYTYYTTNNNGCILIITSNNLEEIIHIIKSIQESTITPDIDLSYLNLTNLTSLNNTNNTNNDDTSTNTNTNTNTNTKNSNSAKNSKTKSSQEDDYTGDEYFVVNPNTGKREYGKAHPNYGTPNDYLQEQHTK